MTELLREIAQNLKRNRTRTALTGFAVAWGIFMLIVLLGMARGVMNNFTYEMDNQSMNQLSVYGGVTVYPYRGFKEGRLIRLKTTDMQSIAEENTQSVQKVFAENSVDTAVVSTPLGHVSGLTGVYPEKQYFDRNEMRAGRFINDLDMAEGRKSVVISANVAEQLFASPDSALGGTVEAMGLPWKVVGIYESRWRTSSYVPFTTLQALTGGSRDVDKLTVVTAELTDAASAQKAETDVVTTLARVHQFDPREGDGGGVWVWNQFENYLDMLKGLGLMRVAVWAIGILTLLSGIVGISNIMFVAVKERTHEIGIRRAIGAKPRQILTSIVAESVVITTLFGYIGIVAGTAVTLLIKQILGSNSVVRNPGIDLAMAFEVTLVLIAAGAFAGLFPAIKATRIKPVEALRDE